MIFITRNQIKKYTGLTVLLLFFLTAYCTFMVPGCGGYNSGELNLTWRVAPEAGKGTVSRIEAVDNILIVYDRFSISAFDTSNGHIIWSRQYSGFNDVSPEFAFKTYDDKLFVPLGCSSNQRKCLIEEFDVGTGEKLREYEFWTLESLGYPDVLEDPNLPWLSAFDVSDQYIVVSAEEGRLKAVDRQNGMAVWERESVSPTVSSILIANDLVFIGGDRVLALKLASGEQAWERNIIASIYLCYSQGLLVVDEYGSEENPTRLHAIDAKTGNDVWSYADEFFSSVMTRAYDGRLFVCDSGFCVLYCIDLATGKRQWSFKTKGALGEKGNYYPLGLPVVVAGVVYFTSADGFLNALDLDTGKVLDKYNLYYGCPPATDGQYVYVQGGLHYLYKFKKIQKTQ